MRNVCEAAANAGVELSKKIGAPDKKLGTSFTGLVFGLSLHIENQMISQHCFASLAERHNGFIEMKGSNMTSDLFLLFHFCLFKPQQWLLCEWLHCRCVSCHQRSTTQRQNENDKEHREMPGGRFWQKWLAVPDALEE